MPVPIAKLDDALVKTFDRHIKDACAAKDSLDSVAGELAALQGNGASLQRDNLTGLRKSRQQILDRKFMVAFQSAHHLKAELRNKTDEIKDAVKKFGKGLVKIPNASVDGLKDINKNQKTVLNKIKALAIPNGSQNTQALMGIKVLLAGYRNDINAIIAQHDALAARADNDLDKELDEARQRIQNAVAAQLTQAGMANQFHNVILVTDDFKQSGSFRDAVFNLTTTNWKICLTDEPAATQIVTTAAAGWIRRYGIYALKEAHMNMCYASRLNQVLKPILTNPNGSVQNALNAVEQLRLNPSLPEWRKRLDVPTGGGWTMWGTKGAYAGKEVHVTISADSIKLPGGAVNGFTALALRDALFSLPPVDEYKEIHGTLLVDVGVTNAGGVAHPHVYYSGTEMYGDRLLDYYDDYPPPNPPGTAAQHTTAAFAAITALLDNYKVVLRNKCQTAIDNVNAGRDIMGNVPA